MANLIYSPDWFYWKDVVIDAISLVVLLLLGYFSYQYYRFDKSRKRYIFFVGACIVLALSFLFKALANFTLYTHIVRTRDFGLFVLTYYTVQPWDALTVIAVTLSRLLMLVGLYILYNLYYPQEKSSTILLVSYFLLITTYFSDRTYYFFHITALLLLLFVIYRLWQSHRRTRDTPAFFIFLSFCIIALSQVSFIFVKVSHLFYAVAEIIQLLGFMLLLGSFILVLRYGAKKIKS